ncbi:serine protease [Paenibacillus odorifer]|uniref:Serine protease n=2 Tax=Paenibacillus TaxID=44249 RepID=A0A1R0X0B1_9BACL|nr:serine protease [Paenibacillus odorifer]OME46099.1 serine protease [Paenibacillus odorifer]
MGAFMPLGTCFMINKSGLFVTAAHVVNGSDKDLVLRRNTQYLDGYQIPITESDVCAPIKIEALDPLRDICVFSLPEPFTSTITISGTDVVEPGDEVTVFGFPHSNLGRLVLTQQTCEVGAKIWLNSGPIKSKHIVLNIQARPGQSGGPVIRNSDLSLVGILLGAYVPKAQGTISLGGIDPQTLHQTTHAISIEYIEGML